MVPIFRAYIDSDGTLRLSEAQRGLLERHLATLRDKPVDVVIRRHQEQRTTPQNRFYFGVVVPLIAEHCGYTKDEMHELLAMRFLRLDDDPVTGSPRRKHTPETDTQEFKEYLDACIQFAAELDVYIPDPAMVAA